MVTDAHGRSTVAATRCLAAHGYQVTVAAHGRPAIAHWSRGCHRRLWVPDPRTQPRQFVEALGAAAGGDDRVVLLAGTDISLVALSEHRGRLGPGILTGLPDHETVLRCLDKVALAAAADTAGISSPQTIVVRDHAHARSAAAQLGFPLILKPRRAAYRHGGRLTRQGGRLIANAADLTDLDDEFLLQRCEPGVVLSCAGATTGDRLLGLAVSRYERTWPAPAGNVSASVSVRPPRRLAEAAERLVRALGWRGQFEIELVERPDGSWTAIDFNPRIYGSMALAEAAGAPLSALWCDWLTAGRAPDSAVLARSGVRYRWEEAEARNLGAAIRARQPRRSGAILRRRRHVVRALFRPGDPGPALARAAFLVARLANRAAHRIRQLPPPPEEALTGPPGAVARGWTIVSGDRVVERTPSKPS